ncbi:MULTISPECIES: hypothetical protein [Pseudomonadaceae]|uniref:hypothetical protein n=1 Tax=Pseudomonadaceae TaxID=135621 RepID=UPI00114D82D7|nr:MULTISPECIES: hypothetical protein [Pseudomonas]MCP1618572.1 hypothetical protein [Pseudomonas otitidis]
MKEFAAVEEVLFVFNSWVLMVCAPLSRTPGVGISLTLLDERKDKVGEAVVRKILTSRNPKIIPIEIGVISFFEDFGKIKYISFDGVGGVK